MKSIPLNVILINMVAERKKKTYNLNSMKVEGIILAAGFSSRTGDFKLELPIDGRPILEYVIETMVDFCSKIFIVSGYQSERIQRLARKYIKAEVIFNPDYESGMASSVKTGIRHITGERFFITPGDCPLITKEVYRKLLSSDSGVVIPVYKNKKGHPVLVKKDIGVRFLSFPPLLTLRDLFSDTGYTTVEVEDEGILLDIDTPADYEKVKALIDKR
ncbi:MAG: nucleotidyltransferase family protein [Spirochaetota bacterium]